MRNKKYIILNFTHGNAPYLRTTELALAVNDLLEEAGFNRLGIIVPWVYKTRQISIMKDNFGKVIKKKRGEILLDKNIGEYFNSVFYGEETFEKSLENLIEKHKDVNKKIEDYFSEGLKTEDFFGNEVVVNREDIIMEINRCPVVSFGIKPSYYTSFAYMSEILENSLGKTDIINIQENLLRKSADYYFELEKKQDLRFIAEPGTFYYLNKKEKHKSQFYTPPNTRQIPRTPFFSFFRKGIYVNVTGIVGFNKHLFEETNSFGLKIYTNKPGLIFSGKKAKPDVISSKNIVFHYARAGWGSIWLSYFTKTPFIAMPYNPDDDPEIYFNNICIEKIGLGKIYTGQPIGELLKFAEEYKNNVELINNQLLNKYGTLDGVGYTARHIVEHFLSSNKLS